MLSSIRLFSKTVFVFLIPAILSPLLFFDSKICLCIFAIALLTGYWIAEVVPIAITSLLPLFLFPALGIMSAKMAAQQYLKDTSVMLLITLIAAIAVEECQLHRRIALKVLSRTGGHFHWTLLAFAIVTAFVSFWLTDSATTALMLPIAVAALEAMELNHNDPELRKSSGEWKCLVLICSHASLIGGTGVITSTAANLIFRDNIETSYPNQEVKMTYLTWMAFAIPPLFGYLLASWIILQFVFLGPHQLVTMIRGYNREETKQVDRMQKGIKQMCEDLRPMTFAEKSVLFLYSVMIALWMFRDPGFVPGWSSLIGDERRKLISDGTVGILVIFAFFIWPNERPDILCWKDKFAQPASKRSLLTWDLVQHKMPWTVMFLIGAGFAISKAVQESGLSDSITCLVLENLQNASPIEVQAVFTTVITFFTETMSNGATASIFVPISLTIAESLHLHPFYLGIPAAIAPSFAFMLPMATPPNAIVYETGVLKMWEMALAGVLLNFVCIGMTIFNMNTWTYWFFSMADFHDVSVTRNSTVVC